MNGKILVVDDEADIRLLLRMELEERGFTVPEAGNGPEGIERFKAEYPDLVIADLRMPGMDGLAMIREMRKLDDMAQFIILTGYASIESVLQCIHQNLVYDYLVKPLSNMEDFIYTVQRAIEKRRLIIEKNNYLEALKQTNKKLEKAGAELEEKAAATENAYRQLKETQEMLIRSEKLSAIGELVSAVAHEINNPLTSILGYAQLLSQVSDTDRIRNGLRTIEKEALRTAKIVKNMLAFSDTGKIRQEAVNINTLIEQTLDFLSYDLHNHNIRVIKDFDKTLPVIKGDGHQIQQVFANIIINAKQAITQAFRMGTLEVRTRYEPERAVVIAEIADDGPGIPDDIRKRIFEPFFTTKRPGRGTGLGLSVSYSIIKEHDGDISADRREPHGTIFTIRFPRPVGKEIASGPAKTVPQRRGEHRVLVVDDEPIILKLTCDILTREGYDVETVTAGKIALEKLETGRYDLMLADIIMPDIDGKELFNTIRDMGLLPPGGVIFMTGDTMSYETSRFLESSGATYITKPFTVEDIKNIVSARIASLAAR
ncbi:MAG: response regulator [Desulfovibrionales bacterium]|nr:response regulator [Desulfovibrionales bacterium]